MPRIGKGKKEGGLGSPAKVSRQLARRGNTAMNYSREPRCIS
jgi:hypothetical protein